MLRFEEKEFGAHDTPAHPGLYKLNAMVSLSTWRKWRRKRCEQARCDGGDLPGRRSFTSL